MKKLSVLLSLLMFLSISVSAAMKPTDDMKSTATEYESTDAQWYAKEALGMLYSEIVYGGWKVEVNKKGEKTVDLKWKNAFTEKYLKKDLGNSSQYLKPGMAALIGDKQAPITDAEAKQFFDDMRLTLQLEDLRIKYDNDTKQFKEEYAFLSEHKIIIIPTENELLQKYASLADWRDELIDEVSDLE